MFFFTSKDDKSKVYSRHTMDKDVVVYAVRDPTRYYMLMSVYMYVRNVW